MPQEAVGTSGDRRGVRDDDDPRVPAPPERRNGPPSERLRSDGNGQSREPKGARKGPREKEHLARARDREEGVDHDHDSVGAAPRLDASRREGHAGVSAREEKLRAPLADEEAQESEIEQDGGGDYHCRRTSSEQKPGPIAMRRPRSPITGSPEARSCLLYTSDAADDLLCVDLGG